MGFANMGEIDRARAAAAPAPYGRILFVGPPPGSVAARGGVNFRQGTVSVPAPRRRAPVQTFDRSPASLPVPQWTPWGWQAPVPGHTLEKF